MARVVTPVFGWDTPVLGEEADVPKDLGALALDIENSLKVLDPKFLATAGAGDAKKLLIVQNTGAAAFKALNGDATISEAGALTIANEAITTLKVLNLAITEAKLAGESVSTAKLAALGVTEAKLAALAVSTGKIANAAVTSAKLKLETFQVAPTENTNLGEGYSTPLGCEILVTPTVPSVLHLHIHVYAKAAATENLSEVVASIKDNELPESTRVAITNVRGTAVANWGNCTMSYILPLTAAAHSVRLRVKRVGANLAVVQQFGTGMTGILMAS